MDPILSVSNLTKKFSSRAGDFTAVDNISFEINEGEVLGFLGPNGAGKTTTINMLLGLIKPTSGKIEIFSQDLENHRQEIMQKVSFASAYSALQGRLTIYENLFVYSLLYGLSEKRAKILGVLEDTDISELKDQMFGSLSSGQKTRVILAKALLPRPRLLLLDEPTASLDPDIAEKVQDLILRIVQKHKVSVLYTSHNMVEVHKMCNRIIFLLKGKIIKQSNPADLVKKMEKKDLDEVFISLVRGN